MGADRAIHVEVAGAEYETMQPIHVAKILAKLSQDEKADIIIVGKQVSEIFFIVVLFRNWSEELRRIEFDLNEDFHFFSFSFLENKIYYHFRDTNFLL